MWVFGYKVHMVVDARHDIPLTVAVTTGSQSDMTYLAPVVEETSPRPGVVIADRGYDSRDNSEWLHRRGIASVIHKRRPQSGFHTRDNGRNKLEHVVISPKIWLSHEGSAPISGRSGRAVNLARG